MSDYKNTKWANKITKLQKDDGSWGYFHTLSEPKPEQPMTTEQALRRLRILGFEKEDMVIKKALYYMHDCLSGRKAIPDHREKGLDWDVFTDLMLATWIRRFTHEDSLANDIAEKWRNAAVAAFCTGQYNAEAFYNAFDKRPNQKYGRLAGLDTYYPISLLAGEIDENIEKAYYNYIINSETGYYYGFTGSITRLPNEFCSKEASRYLAAIEVYCEHTNKYCKDNLGFVVQWLNDNKNAKGKWDMGTTVKDGVYFPMSDSWRTSELRENDCSYRIEKIISALE